MVMLRSISLLLPPLPSLSKVDAELKRLKKAAAKAPSASLSLAAEEEEPLDPEQAAGYPCCIIFIFYSYLFLKPFWFFQPPLPYSLSAFAT